MDRSPTGRVAGKIIVGIRKVQLPKTLVRFTTFLGQVADNPGLISDKMGQRDVNIFLQSLRRQERVEKKSQEQYDAAARKLVQKQSPAPTDLENPGFFDEEFFDEIQRAESHRTARENENSLEDAELGVFDNEYFQGVLNHTPSRQTKLVSKPPEIEGAADDLNVVDGQYFTSSTQRESQYVVHSPHGFDSSKPLMSHSQTVAQLPPAQSRGADLSFIDSQYFGDEVDQSTSLAEQKGENTNKSPQSCTNREKQTEKSGDTTSAMTSDAPKAALLRRRVRSSEGVKRLQSYVPDFENEPSYHVVDLLEKNIVFHDDKIVCVNKPYSLHSQGGPGVHHSVHKYLPQLAKRLKYDGTLYLCHRLDKNTSGVLLLAKGEEAAVKVKERFEERSVEKTYLALTYGVPRPEHGIIDIPIATETLVNGAYKSVLVSASTKTKRRGVHSAITEYDVLKYNLTAALVELRPKTGRKHQLRVHLADGMGTPILGDHKYSHRHKMAPQRLTRDILEKFHLQQSQARNLPLYLHARKLVLPDYFPNGKQLVLGANLPEFFQRAIRTLKFFR